MFWDKIIILTILAIVGFLIGWIIFSIHFMYTNNKIKRKIKKEGLKKDDRGKTEGRKQNGKSSRREQGIDRSSNSYEAERDSERQDRVQITKASTYGESKQELGKSGDTIELHKPTDL